MFASTDSTRIQFGAGAANMAVTGLSGGVRVAQGAGDALMAFTGASGSRATLVGAGAANMAVTASAFFASQQANAQANMIMSASASGRIVARVGGSAQMRIVTNLDSAFDYLVTGKITFEIDPGDTVRFTI
jgi:putative NIF3 family GTP cyclohydrolase 1 type 2